MAFDVGIIGAMEIEVMELVARLSDCREELIGGMKFYTGRLFDKKTVITRCGIGKVFAAIAAEAMILSFKPSLLINTGVGGGLAKGLATGDVVIADRLVQHDMDTSALGDPKGLVSGINKIYFDADPLAVDILMRAARDLGLNALRGTVASGDRFIADKADKDRITADFGAACCEMEGAAIAQTAFVNSTPFAVVRAISDSADEGATMDYSSFLPIAAKNSRELTLALVKEYK